TNDALYFSRAPIPTCSVTKFNSIPVFKQVCVISFRRDFLRELANLPPTPLEQAESIDMLRAIEHGRRARMAETDVVTQSVETPADLLLVAELMKDEPLLAVYQTSLSRAQAK